MAGRLLLSAKTAMAVTGKKKDVTMVMKCRPSALFRRLAQATLFS
jgi:hypothetical protein